MAGFNRILFLPITIVLLACPPTSCLFLLPCSHSLPHSHTSSLSLTLYLSLSLSLSPTLSPPLTKKSSVRLYKDNSCLLCHFLPFCSFCLLQSEPNLRPTQKPANLYNRTKMKNAVPSMIRKKFNHGRIILFLSNISARPNFLWLPAGFRLELLAADGIDEKNNGVIP